MSKRGIRSKLALTFVGFGALLSLLLTLGLSLAAHNLGERLMDETLHAELDDYIARRMRNPDSLPPATLSVRGYVLTPGKRNDNMPSGLLGLSPGKHQLTLDDTPYRVAVADRGNERYIMLFNEQRQRRREEQFLVYLTVGALIMTLASAAIGWWLAGKIVAPVRELSRRVGQARPEDQHTPVANGLGNDEIGALAQVFDGYLMRMRAFIERERAFTSDVSHELRTPLAIVQGAVELLEEDHHLEPKQHQRIARIGRATQQMINLTSALLLMAREKTTEEQACEVWDVVTEIVDTHRYLLSARTEVELQWLDHPFVAAERTLLGIVIANLIRNAFSFTESGMVSISLGKTCLTVRDTGPGIHEEEIGKVFQHHFKGAASTGSGIGLSLVKRICDRYGWETVIESAQGQGTTAQLFFARPK